MDYFISFLEGIITIISPCLLPMLPIYISYFTGQTHKENKSNTFNLNIRFYKTKLSHHQFYFRCISCDHRYSDGYGFNGIFSFLMKTVI